MIIPPGSSDSNPVMSASLNFMSSLTPASRAFLRAAATALPSLSEADILRRTPLSIAENAFFLSSFHIYGLGSLILLGGRQASAESVVLP